MVRSGWSQSAGPRGVSPSTKARHHQAKNRHVAITATERFLAIHLGALFRQGSAKVAK